MATLIEILDLNKIVFLDTSAKGWTSYGKKGFIPTVSSCQRYDHINPDLIQPELDVIENFMLALQHPSSRTIKQVTDEIKVFQKRIGEEINRLSRQRLKKEKGRGNRRLLNELYQKVKLVSQGSERKEWHTQDSRYDLLSKMIVLLNQELSLKKDTGIFYCSGNRKQKLSQTDERLVAASYYCSLVECRPAIITGDRDFISLFAASYPLLGSDVFLPYNSSFRCAAKSHLARLYELTKKGDYKRVRFKMPDKQFPNNFFLFTNPCASDRTREKILELWQNFYNLPNNNHHSITTKTLQKSL